MHIYICHGAVYQNMALYELPLERALDVGTYNSTPENEVRTTVVLPQPIRITLSALKEQREDPMKYIVEQVVAHGHSILQYEQAESIETIRVARKELAYPKMQPIRNFLHETKFTIDGMMRPSKKTIRLLKKTIEPIRDKAIVLNIEQSSMIRLCIYFSFATAYSIDLSIVKSAKYEVEVFKNRLIELLVLFPGLAQMDEEYNKLTMPLETIIK